MAKTTSKTEVPDIKRRDLIVPIQCGQCIFFRRHAIFDRPCSEQGTVNASKTCRRFSPDPVQMDEAQRLGKALRVIAGAKNPLLMAAALLTAKRVSNHGFAIGERVFFRVAGGDYLCNYASAIVVSGTKDRVILAGIESFTAFMFPRALLNAEQFEKKRARLVKDGKINDPEGGFQKLKVGSTSRLMVHIPEIMRKRRKRGRPPKKITTTVSSKEYDRGPIRIGAR